MKSTRPYRKLLTLTAAAALIALFSGCATTVDPDEVQQRANPVGEMYGELKAEIQAEKSALTWYSYGDAFVQARRQDKIVMAVFETSWCKWCKKLEDETFRDAAVRDKINAGFVATKIDAESYKLVFHEMRQLTMQELADLYEVKGYPTIWFLASDGTRLKLLDGYLPGNSFAAYLDYIKSGAYGDMEFEGYIERSEASP